MIDSPFFTIYDANPERPLPYDVAMEQAKREFEALMRLEKAKHPRSKKNVPQKHTSS